MILTQPIIKQLLKENKIKISPLDLKAIGPASIDLTLGKFIRVFVHDQQLTVTEGIDYDVHTKKVSLSKGYLLKPGELVLGITQEKITLPDNICGWLQSRSRFARLGLMSHVTAPFICPGVSNRQVLEIYNAGPQALVLQAGVKICQIILQECRGSAVYQGKFRSQRL